MGLSRSLGAYIPDREKYIARFCGRNTHPNVMSAEAQCNIQLGPLEERCETCGLITGIGWLTEHFQKQNQRISDLEASVEVIAKILKGLKEKMDATTSD